MQCTEQKSMTRIRQTTILDEGAQLKLKLKPGDTVRVVGSRNTAKIRAILTDVHGALLKTQIDGFRLWNLDELRLVKRGRSKVK